MTRSWRARPVPQRGDKRLFAGRKANFVLDSDDLDVHTHADDLEPQELQQGAREKFAPARPSSACSTREVPLECLLVPSKRAAAKRQRQTLTDGEAFEMVENDAAVLVLDAGVDIDEWEVVSDDEVDGKRLKQRLSYSAVVRGEGWSSRSIAKSGIP